MIKFLKLFLFVILFSSIQNSPASADVVYLQDQGERFSISFPDRWRVVSNIAPDDKLVVAANGAPEDHASCRVRVRDDARFGIYPHRYDPSIQKIAYSREFWDGYIGAYDDTTLVSVTDGAQLGRGFASYANVEFTSVTGARVQKRGIMFASLYGNKAYIVDCSAHVDAYASWHDAFMSVIKTVDFEQAIHRNADYGYRSFLKDPILIVNGGAEYNHTYY